MQFGFLSICMDLCIPEESLAYALLQGPSKPCAGKVFTEGAGCLQAHSGIENKLLHGLKWAVPCITAITRSVEVRIGQHVLSPDLPLDSALQDILSSKADLSSIRCFKSDAAAPSAKAFAEWVLQHAPRVEVLQLPASAQLGQLLHLKHLEIEASVFAQEVSKAAQQLPSLETLYLHTNKWGTHLAEGSINLAGCQHLKHLVVQGRFAHALSVRHGPKCHVTVHVSGNFLKHPRFADQAAVEEAVKAVSDLVLHAEEADSCRRLPQDPGMCARFAHVQYLTVKWPVYWEKRTDKPDIGHAVETAKGLLGSFMPANAQPLTSLKRLIIGAEGAIACSIPGGLPNLEELVLYAGGMAEVSFDNPSATLSAVKTLYVFGQPLPNMGDCDLLSAKEKAAKRGLLLSVASTKKAGKGYRRRSACMYLRPVAAPELSFQEAYDRVSRLARQCRCRACSDCLSRAGCLTYS